MTGTITRNREILTAEIDDALLMLSIEKGQYYGVKGVGPRIWELLAEPMTPTALVEQLVAEYEVEPEVCAEQVARFLDGMRTRGLLLDQA
jgi:hypothetical protein